MLVRTWSTKVDKERVEEYEAFANRYSLPMFQKQDGCLGVLFLKGPADFKVITLWRDAPAIEALNNSKTYKQTVGAIEAQGFLTGQQQIEIYEYHGGWLMGSRGADN